jgi:predicted ATPase/class 3 adenylate cyclase/Tfp pilus assembly protein PilF
MSEQKALLLTDVVDSTRLAEALGDSATAALWLAHDRLARDLLPAWRGREIDKTDGMLLLFDAAADALGYAAAYQRGLRLLEPPLSARAGLHVGSVTLRANSPADIARGAKPLEVDGAAKAATARVMSVAGGGQTLLSASARRALPELGLHVQSHGHWCLKGLTEPVELFEVAEDGAPCTPPPDADKAYRVVWQREMWLPVREIRHSLPAERDGFVGRADALAELAQHMHSGARLVSVLGMGGSGKTRLAVRFGWTRLGDFPGGVWFCDLSQARGLDDIVHAVAAALDVPLGKDDPVIQLGHAIAGRGPCLMILDNFEQVALHAQQTLEHWLDRAGEARYVVTTREMLGLAGEESMALPPLPPDDAATLFVRRAEATRPTPQRDVDDDATIAQLVKLLDGLPLAIELAAARVRVMPPRMLLARMGERFKLLSSARGRQDRQATLRATFDWSWDLLSMSDKSALAQLSVFDGGFTLEAAEVVLDLSACDEDAWPAGAVHSLVDKSFVRPAPDARFDLLVSVKEYAAEHLATDGRFIGSGAPALRAAQERHAGYFASLGTERAIESACADLDNLVSACRRAASMGKGTLATGALEGAWAALARRGPFRTGVELAESVCAMSGLDDGSAAHAQAALADALMACGKADSALAGYERALACARAAGDRLCETKVMLGLGWLCLHHGQVSEARQHYLASMQMARALDDRALEFTACSGLGNVELAQGHADGALASYQRALSLARELGNRSMQCALLANLGNLYAEIGRLSEAQAHDEEALALARDTGHRAVEGNTLCNLGQLHLVQGRLDESLAASNAALLLARELGHIRLESIVLCNLGIALEKLARPDAAQAQYEAALRIIRTQGDQRMEGQYLGYLGLLHARQGRREDARRCLESGEALLRAVSDSLGLGVLLCSRAETHWLAGDHDAAAGALGEAAALAVQVGAGQVSELGLALRHVRALIEPT